MRLELVSRGRFPILPALPRKPALPSPRGHRFGSLLFDGRNRGETSSESDQEDANGASEYCIVNIRTMLQYFDGAELRCDALRGVGWRVRHIQAIAYRSSQHDRTPLQSTFARPLKQANIISVDGAASSNGASSRWGKKNLRHYFTR
jgi:hypothetical protein